MNEWRMIFTIDVKNVVILLSLCTCTTSILELEYIDLNQSIESIFLQKEVVIKIVACPWACSCARFLVCDCKFYWEIFAIPRKHQRMLAILAYCSVARTIWSKCQTTFLSYFHVFRWARVTLDSGLRFPDILINFIMRQTSRTDAFFGVLVLLLVFYWYLYWYLHW